MRKSKKLKGIKMRNHRDVFYVKTNMLTDFQVFISVHLK